MHGHLIHDKGNSAMGKRIIFSINVTAGLIGCVKTNINNGVNTTPLFKKLIPNGSLTKCDNKTIKLLEENIERHLYDVSRQSFLQQDIKGPNHREKRIPTYVYI